MINKKQFSFSRNLVPWFYCLLIFSSVFLSSSCDVGVSEDIGRVFGTAGLEMNIMRTSIPSRIYEEEPIYLSLKLSNKGYADILDGVIFVSVDSQKISVQNYDEFKNFNLRGDDGFVRGDEKLLQISLLPMKIKIDNILSQDANLRINSCYAYSTFFEDVFCIDTDVHGMQSQKSCIMKPLTGRRGQGAPVAITRVEPRSALGESGVSISFDIYIQNLGGGTVLKRSSYKSICTGEFGVDDLNNIRIAEIVLSSYTLSNGDFSCSSHTPQINEFVLGGSRDYISCKLNHEIELERGAFSTPINIKLDYGYLETIEERLLIQKR